VRIFIALFANIFLLNIFISFWCVLLLIFFVLFAKFAHSFQGVVWLVSFCLPTMFKITYLVVCEYFPPFAWLVNQGVLFVGKLHGCVRIQDC
jgi:hypothetical protein